MPESYGIGKVYPEKNSKTIAKTAKRYDNKNQQD
jgi:hypothetical protein